MYQRIRYFLKAAERGSFSLAAQELFVSPQALTKQIGVLETELGGELFVRSHRGIMLTGFGEYAKRKLERVSGEFDAAIAEVRAYAGSGRERISVGVFSALPRENLVLPLVSFLLAGYPDCRLALEMIQLGEGLQRFLSGELDFLLTNIHEQNDLGTYRRLSFGSYDAKVVVSLVHPWAVREGITAEDLRKEPFIKMRMDEERYTVPGEASFYRNIPCKEVVEVSNFETMMVMLGQGAGFAVFPLAFMNMERAQIKSFDYPAGPPLRFATALLYDPANPRAVIRKVAEELKEQFDLKEL